jgi:hypothetical protein
MTDALRCSRCGGVRVTPLTAVSTAGGHPQLWYRKPDAGVFTLPIRLQCQGCACLDCANVMLFLEPEALAEARAMPSFTPF